MNKIKLLFGQSLMISTGILAAIGIENVIRYFHDGVFKLDWPWYVPISIVFCGIVCSIPTLLILDTDDLSKEAFRVRKIIHFLCVGAILSLFGFLFGWYETLPGYLIIMAMYLVIYVFVWVATMWVFKTEDKKINDAISEMRDEE